VLLVGVGAIGEELTRLLAPFAAHLVGIDARRREPPPGMAEVHAPDQLDQLLSAADFVILTIPHTPRTAGLIDRRRLRLMKPSAFLINVGRGATVRLDDLTAALAAGEVAGAGLDVFEREPLPPGHPLWTAERVLITPHVAGAGPHVRERRTALVAENARRFAAGQELCCVVDKASWY
jgi:phosphoglycerate dehydrogenase-like enzyme